MVERRAGGGSPAAPEKPDLAKIIPARQIREDQLTARIPFGNFYKSQAHQIETIGGLPLLANHLARREAQQFDAFAKVIDKILRKAAKNRNIS